MKIQLLPNYFKWIGLLMFILGGVPDFIEGYNGYSHGACEGCNHDTITSPFSEQTAFILSIISLLGIIVYSISKEKIEDEFIKILRWESITTTFVLSVIFILGQTILYGRENTPFASTLLEYQMLIYLIIFFFKKRSNLGDIA